MNLPDIITNLITAQNNLDAAAYADCFSDAAVVFDEGEKHTGRTEIRRWNEMTNTKYQTRLEPVDLAGQAAKPVLTAKVSGTFAGSPLLLDFHFEIRNGKISSLQVTEHQMSQP
jgi:ketosteroid isomerase-like protein